MVPVYRTLIFASAVFSVGCLPVPAVADTSADCSQLRSLTLANTTITSAGLVAPAGGLPEYCRVVGYIDTEINFELRLPTAWNQRFLFQGYGGLDGVAPSVVQTLNLGNPGQPLALQLGFAVVTTDTGHMSTDGTVYDGSWAYEHPDRQINWAYRSTHVVGIAGKAITSAYYHRMPTFSYYVGCSGGGRHAAMSASRYPTDFDGVIASAPFLSPIGQTVAWNWDEQALAANPIPPAKLPLITNAVLAACDAKDRVVDGLLSDPGRCDFDPNVLKCSAGDQPNCLTAGEISSLKKLYSGPYDSSGRQLFPGWEPGVEYPLWLGALVNSVNGGPGELGVLLPDQILKYLVFGPQYDPYSFDFDIDPASLTAAAQLFDVKPQFADFARAGGKMLMWQGWNDPRLAPDYTTAFYEAVQRNLRHDHHGKPIDIDDFYRLFMAPGVGHCGGGPGPNVFDALGALQKWVEQGIAPDVINASHLTDGVVDRTRPLCPYPQEAVYSGKGNINDAASFDCRIRHVNDKQG
jgi:feruloyl esterase